MKVKITNKKDKTDSYSLNLSKAFGVRRMGDFAKWYEETYKNQSNQEKQQ